jgi:hypothetical protein
MPRAHVRIACMVGARLRENFGREFNGRGRTSRPPGKFVLKTFLVQPALR